MSSVEFDYTRYLVAKESIDERSLNPLVWEHCLNYVSNHAGSRIDVLEVGCGVGSTFRRFLKSEFSKSITYTLLDVEASHQAYFRKHVPVWLKDLGFEALPVEMEGYERYARGMQLVDLQFVLSDVEDYIANPEHLAHFDLLVGQSFLDLFDIETFVPRLLHVLKKGGGFYFPINFDGVSSILPIIEPELDRAIEKRYHDSMDERGKHNHTSPRSETGRHLLTFLKSIGINVVAAGSSDWIVFSNGDGTYHRDEAYFLAQILQFTANELTRSPVIDNQQAESWLTKRREQLNSGDLIYIAHQNDIFGLISPD